MTAPLALPLRLTLLALLLHPLGAPPLRVGLLALACAGLLSSRVLRHPALWLTLSALLAVRVLQSWPLADNHAYLLVYWSLAAALALAGDDPARDLAWNGRVLVGLAFAFAALWKLALSPDYLDGTFFRVTLLEDRRFADLARTVGGLAPEPYQTLRAFVTTHADGVAGPWREGPRQPAGFVRLAGALSFGTLALEAALALSFLAPLLRGVTRARDPLLLVFCATVYAVATVETFGWLLLAMGLAQCHPGRRSTRAAYLAVYALVLAYRELEPLRWLVG